MEKYSLQDDLKIFGMQVKSFPQGIGEVFEALIKMISGTFDRDYYVFARFPENRRWFISVV